MNGERLPPQSRDAERSVLGSMLRDNTVIGDVLQILRRNGEDFYADPHQKIFRAIIGLYDQAYPADLVTLSECLRDRKQIEDIGGPPYIGELWDAAPTAANVAYYAGIVRDKALVRSLIHAAQEMIRDAYDQARPAAEMLEAAEGELVGIVQEHQIGNAVWLSESINRVCDSIDERYLHGLAGIIGLRTGFVELDELLAGLRPGQLVVIGALTSVGKTAFALCIARHVAQDQNVPVFIATLEMENTELTERLLIGEARVDGHRYQRGVLTVEEYQSLAAAGSRLRPVRIVYDDSPGQTVLRIAANARRFKAKPGIGLVVLDYLQLVESEKRKGSGTRQEEVADISRRLKRLARELQLPVIALSQLNRASEGRTNPPRLSDLRESGAIGQDANVVILLYQSEENSPIVRLKVAKNRNGPTGEIDLTFDRRLCRFESYVPDFADKTIVPLGGNRM